MFELTGTILERIIFAMEDQTKSMLVDMNTGELVERSKTTSTPAPQSADERSSKQPEDAPQSPPKWTPKEGFKLMESFYSTMRSEEHRLELSKALTRGKGVFKAFKEIISAWPEEEAAFREFKLKHMRPVVEDWMDDYREFKGLSRLGSEPEDIDDIILTDFPIEVSAIADVAFSFEEVLDSVFSDSLEYLPFALAEKERRALEKLIEEKPRHCFCVSVKGDDASPIAVALGLIIFEDGTSFGKIRLLYVKKGYKNLELPSLLLAQMISEFHSKNVEVILLDSLFLPAEFQEEIASLGYSPIGVRALASRG